MAEIKEGILGGVHGTVGTVVGFMWRGRYYIRAKPRRSHKPATDEQIKCRSKFGIVSTFASKFKNFVNRHCPPALLNNKMASGKEQLISMLSKEGVTIIDGVPCIDVSAAILSIGPLPPAVIKKINILKTGRIKAAWDNSIINSMTKGTDRLTLVAYHEGYNEVFEIESISKREDKFVHFDLHKDWKDGNVHFWSVWKSADGKLISTSAYHGVVSIGETTDIEDEPKVEEGNELQIRSNTSEVEEGNGLQIRSNASEVEKGNELQIRSNTSEVEKGNELQIHSNTSEVEEGNGLQIRSNASEVEKGNGLQIRSDNDMDKKEKLGKDEKSDALTRSTSSKMDNLNVNYEVRSILEIDIYPKEEEDEEQHE